MIWSLNDLIFYKSSELFIRIYKMSIKHIEVRYKSWISFDILMLLRYVLNTLLENIPFI